MTVIDGDRHSGPTHPSHSRQLGFQHTPLVLPALERQSSVPSASDVLAGSFEVKPSVLARSRRRCPRPPLVYAPHRLDAKDRLQSLHRVSDRSAL
jgi:hypothetical protein